MVDFAALADLDHAEVTRIAERLEAGYLKPPFTALSLQGQVTGDQARDVAECLDALDAARTASASVALALRAYAAGRSADRDISDLVDVVASGPDAAAAARDTGVVMRQLFNRARQRVFAVGFAVHGGRTVFKALADRLDEDASLEAILCVDVRRSQNDTSPEDRITSRFAENFAEREWPGRRLPKVYYDPRSLMPSGPTRSALHAKCVVVDAREALVTSANFTEAAQERNIELGVLLNSPTLARQIEAHFRALIRNGHLERLPLRA